MKSEKYLINISDDQHTVAMLNNVYYFKKSNAGCYKCDLLHNCMEMSKDEANPEYPFPCVESVRDDNMNGVFQDAEKVELKSILKFAFLVVLSLILFFIYTIFC